MKEAGSAARGRQFMVRNRRQVGAKSADPGQGPIHASIARDIGTAIVSGRYPPGHRLGDEITASERLNVSRTAYRDASRILQAKGLLESRPRTGTRVTPRENWNLLDPDVLCWIIESKPSDQFISDLFELRGVVEPAAAAFAALRRDGRQLQAMGHALEEMERNGLETAAGQAADVEFHKVLLRAARNEPLNTLANSVAAAVGITTFFKYERGSVKRDCIPDHRAVFDAIAEGSADKARAAMSRLIELAFEDITGAPSR